VPFVFRLQDWVSVLLLEPLQEPEPLQVEVVTVRDWVPKLVQVAPP